MATSSASAATSWRRAALRPPRFRSPATPSRLRHPYRDHAETPTSYANSRTLSPLRSCSAISRRQRASVFEAFMPQASHRTTTPPTGPATDRSDGYGSIPWLEPP
jgi:hypothetical protein